LAKKRKEVCPYCGKTFAYLSRHKCKIKERVEGPIDDKTASTRRIERIEERKKDLNRNLRKDEKIILNIINKERNLYLKDLLELVNKNQTELEEILDILALQSKIKIKRELVVASWTKHLFAIDDYEEEVDPEKVNVNTDKERQDFVWGMYGYIPCFICPFTDKCSDTNEQNGFNPQNCNFLSEWIKLSLEGIKHKINFSEIIGNYKDK